MTSQIATNMGAVRTHNIFSRNNTSMDSALQRVSTGLKINSAKDGAAQYSISEKMRERINSNQQVSQNIQNDSALAKTASSGLDNTLNILRTMKARALDSANDSNTDENRKTMQKEIDELLDQINYNAKNIKYNGKTLLNGEYSTGFACTSKTILFNDKITDLTTKLNALGVSTDSSLANLSVSWSANGHYFKDDTITSYTSDTKLSDVIANINSMASDTFTISTTAFTDVEQIGTEQDENGDPSKSPGKGIAVVATKEGVKGNFSDLTFTLSPNNPANGASRTFTFKVLQEGKDSKAGIGGALGPLDFQIGEEVGMKVSLTISDMSTAGLEINELNVGTKTSAQGAIDTIDKAINKVLEQQTSIGAMEARLGYVSDQVDTINENLQAADSALRDSDMAKEISTFMKYSVLSQASQYMLSQVNQNAFSVLNLLQ